MFENVNGRTDGRTPARLIYYKLTMSELKRGGECGCRGLDLTQNHLKLEKKTKKRKKVKKIKHCALSGI